MTLDDCQVLRDLAAVCPEAAPAIERTIGEVARLRTAGSSLLGLIDAVPYCDSAGLRLGDAVPQVESLRGLLSK